MRRSPVLCLALLSLAIPFAARPAVAQSCGSPTDTFWKNDILPQNPGGLASVSVIPGLCEGEACGTIFTLPVGMPPQRLKKVAFGFGNQNGLNGFQAVVNLEIYNGVTFSGNTPILGPKIFDLGADALASIPATTTGINEFDMTPFNVVVGNGASNFVVAFRMDINMNGNCATGFGAANFFTDNAGGGGCNAKPKTNLLFVLGTGWVDPSKHTISGFPLCPLFYNGNWVIRACTEDVAPQVCQQSLGLAGPGNLAISLCGGNLSTGTTATFAINNATPNVSALLFVSTTLSPTFVPQLFGVLCPLPVLLTVSLPTGTGNLAIPGVPGGGGPATVYAQAISPDPSQIKGWEISNCLQIVLLP